jgi:lipoyl(octanoyl) transferase
MHGFALNVTQDLAWFNHVVPCGLTEPVTSMTDVLPDRASLKVSAVESALIRELCQEFNVAVAST